MAHADSDKAARSQAREEAAHWLARLCCSNSIQVRSEFRSWLAEDPFHMEVWQLAVDAYAQHDDILEELLRKFSARGVRGNGSSGSGFTKH